MDRKIIFAASVFNTGMWRDEDQASCFSIFWTNHFHDVRTQVRLDRTSPVKGAPRIRDSSSSAATAIVDIFPRGNATEFSTTRKCQRTSRGDKVLMSLLPTELSAEEEYRKRRTRHTRWLGLLAQACWLMACMFCFCFH